MGRKISGGAGDFPATANIKETVGNAFTGIMVGPVKYESQFGEKTKFQFKVVDTDCTFSRNKLPYEPEAGELVEVMGTTTLTRQLTQVLIGEQVIIKYLGLGKAKKGNPPHLFDVEVI